MESWVSSISIAHETALLDDFSNDYKWHLRWKFYSHWWGPCSRDRMLVVLFTHSPGGGIFSGFFHPFFDLPPVHIHFDTIRCEVLSENLTWPFWLQWISKTQVHLKDTKREGIKFVFLHIGNFTIWEREPEEEVHYMDVENVVIKRRMTVEYQRSEENTLNSLCWNWVDLVKT